MSSVPHQAAKSPSLPPLKLLIPLIPLWKRVLKNSSQLSSPPLEIPSKEKPRAKAQIQVLHQQLLQSKLLGRVAAPEAPEEVESPAPHPPADASSVVSVKSEYLYLSMCVQRYCGLSPPL